jgi:excisionase family DNA binding protein
VAVSDEGASAVPARWLTVTEAAQQAEVPRGVVEGWIVNGHLPAVLVDGLRRVRPEDLAAVQEQTLAGVILTWRHDRQHFGRRLRSLRETAGFTRRDLAAASGVSPDTVSRIEAGQYAPYAETVRRLARGLQLEPEQFVSGEPVGETMRLLASGETSAGTTRCPTIG